MLIMFKKLCVDEICDRCVCRDDLAQPRHARSLSLRRFVFLCPCLVFVCFLAVVLCFFFCISLHQRPSEAIAAFSPLVLGCKNVKLCIFSVARVLSSRLWNARPVNKERGFVGNKRQMSICCLTEAPVMSTNSELLRALYSILITADTPTGAGINLQRYHTSRDLADLYFGRLLFTSISHSKSNRSESSNIRVHHHTQAQKH